MKHLIFHYLLSLMVLFNSMPLYAGMSTTKINASIKTSQMIMNEHKTPCNHQKSDCQTKCDNNQCTHLSCASHIYSLLTGNSDLSITLTPNIFSVIPLLSLPHNITSDIERPPQA